MTTTPFRFENATCSVDAAALRKMSMEELRDFRDAIHTMTSVLSGLRSQPRFEKEGDWRQPNIAGAVLEAISEFLSGYEQTAFEVVKAARPTHPYDVECRAQAMLCYEADMCGSLNDLAVMAAEAERDHAAALFRQQKPPSTDLSFRPGARPLSRPGFSVARDRLTATLNVLYKVPCSRSHKRLTSPVSRLVPSVSGFRSISR